MTRRLPMLLARLRKLEAADPSRPTILASEAQARDALLREAAKLEHTGETVRARRLRGVVDGTLTALELEEWAADEQRAGNQGCATLLRSMEPACGSQGGRHA